MFDCRRLWFDRRGSQIVEVALSLPLLVFFVIGIFDFSDAIALKQKLTNAAREGARVAAADPANDLTTSTKAALPVSVADAFWVIDNYLISEKISDCGLSSQLPSTSGSLIWTSTATGCGTTGSSLVLTINRGFVTPQGTVDTQVTIVYPYAWQFGGVSGLFSGSFIPPASITTAAVAFNEN
ncbi:MAG: TadE/TadG family type IV pilus assembly protein [Candidatus Sulfotelmatobacter sp.]